MAGKKSAVLWIILTFVVLAWPPFYMLFLHPRARSFVAPNFVSNTELAGFFGVRRYTIAVPQEYDGHFLTFAYEVDGDVKTSGGATVLGGEKLVLLIRQKKATDEIEYCWSGGNGRSWGTLPNPLADAGVWTQRDEGPISHGDWLFRGGSKSVQVVPATEPAEFELRVTFEKMD